MVVLAAVNQWGSLLMIFFIEKQIVELKELFYTFNIILFYCFEEGVRTFELVWLSGHPKCLINIVFIGYSIGFSFVKGDN